MHRLINIDKEKYDNFVKNHKTKSHFLQSLSWGEFSKTKFSQPLYCYKKIFLCIIVTFMPQEDL